MDAATVGMVLMREIAKLLGNVALASSGAPKALVLTLARNVMEGAIVSEARMRPHATSQAATVLVYSHAAMESASRRSRSVMGSPTAAMAVMSLDVFRK